MNALDRCDCGPECEDIGGGRCRYGECPHYCKLCGSLMQWKTTLWYGQVDRRLKCSNERCGLIA